MPVSKQNLQGLLIGLVGVAITMSAYSQTMLTTNNCLWLGLLVLLYGLLVKEGLIPAF